VIFNTAFLYSVLSYLATAFKEFYDAFVSMKASKEHQGGEVIRKKTEVTLFSELSRRG
jgi:hypothetical protein